MLTDSKLNFVAPGTPLSLVAAVGVDINAPGIIDLLGNGVGQPVTNIWGNSTLPGQADAHGEGPQRPEMVIAIGTALVAGTGTPLLTPALQGAPDDGSGGAGAWQTFWQGPDITVAQGIAGRRICRIPWVPPFPSNLRPRFLRLTFIIPAAVNFSAGTIAFATVTTSPDDWFVAQAARNYTAARGLS